MEQVWLGQPEEIDQNSGDWSNTGESGQLQGADVSGGKKGKMVRGWGNGAGGKRRAVTRLAGGKLVT